MAASLSHGVLVPGQERCTRWLFVCNPYRQRHRNRRPLQGLGRHNVASKRDWDDDTYWYENNAVDAGQQALRVPQESLETPLSLHPASHGLEDLGKEAPGVAEKAQVSAATGTQEHAAWPSHHNDATSTRDANNVNQEMSDDDGVPDVRDSWPNPDDAAKDSVPPMAAAAAASELLQGATQGVRQTAQQLLEQAQGSQPTRVFSRLHSSVEASLADLPEGFWGKVMWLWELPPIKRLRVGVSMANLGFKLPALLVLIATQCNLLASQVSLPMLAPLLLGTGIAIRSIKSNASIVFPRLGIVVAMLWLLWFANTVVANTVKYLQERRALDGRVARMITTTAECFGLVTAMVVVLSLVGVRVSGLLLPAGIAVAVASKDLLHNLLAGLFLFAVQPFKLGDQMSVATTAGGQAQAAAGSWFEGQCIAVDLRYTVLRDGKRRLIIPNSSFLTREFLVIDEEPASHSADAAAGAAQDSRQGDAAVAAMTRDASADGQTDGSFGRRNVNGALGSTPVARA